MSNINLTVEDISKLQPLDIVTNEIVRSRFIQIYDTLWGAGMGEAAYERESIYFNRLLADDEYLRTNSTRFSIFTAFIDLAVCGLSLEQGVRALCYLQGRNAKAGKDPLTGICKYEGRLVLTISGYGELVLRERTGQIRHADNPVLVYAEDEFSFSDTDGKKSVSYTCHIPHKSNKIVACFLRITRTDGTTDYGVMFEEDWVRLKNYSERNNQKWDERARAKVGKANDLYVSNNGGIDTGFLCAKCVKHAFKTYPKVRIGKGTELETQQPENIPDEEDFYGVQEEPAVKPDPNPAFGNTPDTSAGVSINPAANDESEDDGAF